MQLKVSVISDRPDEYVGKRGLVKSQIITCQDREFVLLRFALSLTASLPYLPPPLQYAEG
jgi:hypothetical protein